MIDRESLLLGLILGVIIAGVGGNIFQRIRLAQRGMALPGRPMMVETGETPVGVMQIARRAARACLFWAGVFVIFFAGTIAIVYWLIVVVAR